MWRTSADDLQRMIELIKTLFRRRDRDLIVMIMDPSDVGKQDELRLTGKSQSRWFKWAIIAGGTFALLFVVLLVLRWTAGGDARIRMEINQLASRVESLSDSVLVRDQQLSQIRSTIASGGQPESNNGEQLIDYGNVAQESRQTNSSSQEVTGVVLPADWNRLTRNNLGRPRIRGAADSVFNASDFLARLPVPGRVTRSYMPETGHFGTDIAVREGTVLRSVAMGTVIGSDWTIPYGYVISIIHEDGHVIVFKHLTTSSVQSGDILQKGDQIGLVGMAGTLSSGPHLHIELWKNGSHIDPMSYFIE